jgi:HD-GYP domain-containing protein (c-di-GMP phosphodiesterase class II)
VPAVTEVARPETPRPETARLRLAELVAALSLGIDLGFGQPMEHVLRQTMIALRLAEQVGLDDETRLGVYYTALLVNVGCHADAHEQAKWFGDDVAMKATKYDKEMVGVLSTVSMLRQIGAGNPPLHRFRVGLEFAMSGRHDLDGMIEGHSALARALATQLGLPETVQEAVGSSYERWDGRGWPGALKGDAIPIASRLAQLAEYTEVAHRIGGVDAAVELARKRAGSQFDPELAAVLCSRPDVVLGEGESTETWDAVIAAEPSLGVELTPSQFDQALLAVANFVDLKSPYMLGHAGAVSELAEAAAGGMGLASTEVDVVRGAGLLHGLGRLGVSNSIWDKRAPLGAGEWERVRLTPYLTHRMLRQSVALAPLGDIAVQLRERLDGSGYPSGIAGSAISGPARVLAAADVYRSMREPRPHREARSAERAASELRADARSGRLDGDAVAAVLAAAGHTVSRRQDRPAGLTAREVDVLRLLSRGLSSKEIASRLVISPKTARNHIEHIYVKIGASSRVTASHFALQQGLMSGDDVTTM